MSRYRELISRMRWLGKSGFLIEDCQTVYIDPVDVPAGLPKAGIVFLTHPHGGHYDEKAVQSVSHDSTIVVGPRPCVERFRLNQKPVRPGDCGEVLNVWIKPVAAYCPRERTEHPQADQWLGFFIQFQDVSVYHPGHTSLVPEMENVHPDILLFPVAGRDLFAPDEIGSFIRMTKAKAVVPMHYEPGKDDAALVPLKAACAELGVQYHELGAAAQTCGGSHV